MDGNYMRVVVFIIALIIGANTALAQCTNPDAQVGTVVYNPNAFVYQGCTPDGWFAFHDSPEYVECPETGLVNHWGFDETVNSTTAYDHTGTSYGLMTNMDPATDRVGGKLGNALDFDNTDDYVSIAKDGADLAGSSITISAWIYPRDLSNSQSRYEIISNTELSDPWHGFTFYISGGADYGTCQPGDICLWANDGSASSNYHDGVPHGMTENNWYHVVVTGNSSTGVVTWYVNGVNKGSQTKTRGIGDNSDDIVSIGSEGGNSNWFDGIIDDVRIYNRVLDASEIAALYNGGTGCKPVTLLPQCPVNNLQAYWNLDERSGTNAADSTANNDGTLTNMDPATDWVAGKIGGALDFDGADDVVLMGDHQLAKNALTISAWVKTHDVANLDGYVVSKYNTDIAGREYALYFDRSTNDIRLVVGNADGTSFQQADLWGLSSLVTDGIWYHVVFTRNGSDVHGYFNGTDIQQQVLITA
jgi:hypothetical protein